MNGRLWMQDREDASQVRRSLFQYVQPFAPHRTIVSRASGDIAAGMRETGNESGADRITDTEEYHRHIPRYGTVGFCRVDSRRSNWHVGLGPEGDLSGAEIEKGALVLLWYCCP